MGAYKRGAEKYTGSNFANYRWLLDLFTDKTEDARCNYNGYDLQQQYCQRVCYIMEKGFLKLLPAGYVRGLYGFGYLTGFQSFSLRYYKIYQRRETADYKDIKQQVSKILHLLLEGSTRISIGPVTGLVYDTWTDPTKPVPAG